MVEGKNETNDIDKYPEEVEDIMSVWALYKRTGGFSASMVNVSSHSSTKKCWSKVDCDASKPDVKAVIILKNKFC